MDNTVDIIQVFPNKSSDARVVWCSFVSPILGFVARSRALDHGVIQEGLSNVWNFRLKNKSDITVKNSHGVRRPLWKGGVPECTKGGLKTSQVTGGDIERPVVITNEEVEHRKT